MIFSE
jgi:hypothetical protein